MHSNASEDIAGGLPLRAFRLHSRCAPGRDFAKTGASMLPRGHAASVEIIVSASTSTCHSGSIKPDTWTKVKAGRISEKRSPCARAASFHLRMSVSRTQVRIISVNDPRKLVIACSIISKQRLVCTQTSRPTVAVPSAAIGAVPEIATGAPTCTARAKPISGSRSDPDKTSRRLLVRCIDTLHHAQPIPCACSTRYSIKNLRLPNRHLIKANWSIFSPIANFPLRGRKGHSKRRPGVSEFVNGFGRRPLRQRGKAPGPSSESVRGRNPRGIEARNVPRAMAI
jgi:hypothetical protein